MPAVQTALFFRPVQTSLSGTGLILNTTICKYIHDKVISLLIRKAAHMGYYKILFTSNRHKNQNQSLSLKMKQTCQSLLSRT
jgi:hypothetical protein